MPCTRDAVGRIEPRAEVVAVLQTEIDRMDALASDLARSRELLASILLDSGVPPSGRDARAPAGAPTLEEPTPGP
ncbi:hypothetical protein ABZV91_17300 [Nocardia sp. NPDC004568]|uniref:hypothetical protein n=1 Tax=Nocardia sp. NPDC004568 TaxID=3154551 RepID=UPI0033A5D70D